MSKLLIVIVHHDDAGRVVNALRDTGLGVTQLRSTGGFLRARNATLLIGLDDERVPEAVGVVERNCRARTQQVPMDALPGMEAGWWRLRG